MYPSHNVNIPSVIILAGNVLAPLQQKIYISIVKAMPTATHNNHEFWTWNVKYATLYIESAVIATVIANWTEE